MKGGGGEVLFDNFLQKSRCNIACIVYFKKKIKKKLDFHNENE